jgi:hypothetical protein cdiviTM7_00105
MKISVIIPCRNEAGVIDHLLESLTIQTKKPDEIIVVDSASTDNTVECAEAYSSKLPLKIIKVSEKGSSKARNSGASEAAGDMLVFIDADTILPKYFIQSFENRVNEKHFQAGSFTQKMNSDNLAIRAGAHFMSGYMRLMQYTPWPIGFGCLYITKEAFNAVDGFDESLYIMEDYDIILQAKRAGYKIGIIKMGCLASDRRYRNNSLRQILRGIYGELYRYTHGLRITKPIYEYNMGGEDKDNSKDTDPSKQKFK